MSVIGSNILAGASGGAGAAAADFKIERSLRFNPADTAHLDRTPSTAGNRKTFTFSAWVKLSGIGTGFYTIFQADSDDFRISSNVIGLNNSGTAVTSTTAVYRDPSAWYHVVLVVDNTLSSNRTKIYVNNSLEAQGDTYSQNENTPFNNTAAHYIGRNPNASGREFDGYLADVHFIDGQALAPTDFGEYDDHNVWQPKEASFTSPNDGTIWSSSLSSAAGFQSSAPATNVFDGDIFSKAATPSNTGGYYTGETNAIEFIPSSSIPFTSSVKVTGRGTGQTTAKAKIDTGSGYGSEINLSGDGIETVFSGSGNLVKLKVWTVTYAGENELGAILIDDVPLVDGVGKYGINGFNLDLSDGSSNVALGYDQSVATPSPNPDGGMDVVTYTGNGGTQDIGGLGFKPGLVWIKSRTTTQNHKLFDIVRGTGKELVANLTDAEFSDSNQLSAFNSNGFSVGSGLAVNQSSQNYVAWTWRAGGSAVANTNGTLNSQVSANNDYGFSIVSYTGSLGTGSFGHGLSTAPSFVIIKNREESQNWTIYHKSLTLGDYFKFTTDAAIDYPMFNDAHPNSSVVYVGNDDQVSKNGIDYIAYCWSEVSGFSKFSSYTGTGASGNKQTLGFKPRWVMIKCYTNAGQEWVIFDTKRNPSNPADDYLYAQSSATEASYSDRRIKVLDDGFEFYGDDGAINFNNFGYIFIAFADRPGNNFDVNNLVATVVNYNSTLTAISSSETVGSPENAFDNDTSTTVSGITGGIKFTPLGGSQSNVTSLRFYSKSFGQGGRIKLNGTTIETDYDFGQGGWYSFSSTALSNIGNTLTSFEWDRQPGSGSNNNDYLYGVEINGNVLVNTGNFEDIDSLIDTPTNYDDGTNVGGNYATLNPLQNGATLANGNLDASSGQNKAVFATIPVGETGKKFYWEATLNGSNLQQVGIADVAVGKTSTAPGDAGSEGYILLTNGSIYHEGSTTSTGHSTFTTGDVVGIKYDDTTRSISWNKNGGSFFGAVTVDDGRRYAPVFGSGGGSDQISVSVNFGQRPFAYTPPTGHVSLCTQNLPDPTIADGSDYFDVITRNGLGSSGGNITGLGFSPDLVWEKARSTTSDHYLMDTVRGATKDLRSNKTQAENTNANYLTTFNSDGYTVGSADWSTSTTVVSWAWDAGSSTVSNTDGSITSNVRANASAGFSIVSYTANGTNSTVGHGLNAAPELVIIKGRDSVAENWKVYHKEFGTSGSLHLNLTTQDASSTAFNQTAPTSSVFSIGIHSATNQNTKNYIAYCFAPVEGYSAIGSYTGNGSSDGPFVFTGMRPKWILIKHSSANGNNWIIYDTSRNTSNVAGKQLYPNLNAAEADATLATHARLDIVSNGFKLRGSHSSFNTNNETMIYAAFAEHPFKTARAR